MKIATINTIKKTKELDRYRILAESAIKCGNVQYAKYIQNAIIPKTIIIPIIFFGFMTLGFW